MSDLTKIKEQLFVGESGSVTIDQMLLATATREEREEFEKAFKDGTLKNPELEVLIYGDNFTDKVVVTWRKKKDEPNAEA